MNDSLAGRHEPVSAEHAERVIKALYSIYFALLAVMTALAGILGAIMGSHR